jgi:hypothetical protein
VYGSLVGHTANEILSRPEEPVRWLVPGMAAFGALTTLGGYVGAGKTPLALRLASSVRRGEQFLGRPVMAPPEEVRVAYLTEEPRYSFDQALRDAGVGPDKGFAVFYWDENATVPYEQAVEDAAAWTDGGLLFVDTAFFWSGSSDLGAENDPGKMNEVYRPLVKQAARGCAVWAHAHTVKTFDRVPDEDADISAVRGSGAVVANSSVILLYKKVAGNPSSDTRFLRVGRTRLGLGGAPRDRYVALQDGQLVVHGGLFVQMERQEHLVQRVEQMIREAGGQMSNPDLKRAWRGEWQALVDALGLGVSSGRLRRSGAGRRGSPYVYSVPQVAARPGENGEAGAALIPYSVRPPMFPNGNSFLADGNAVDSVGRKESHGDPTPSEDVDDIVDKARREGRLREDRPKLRRVKKTFDEVLGKRITLVEREDGTFGMEPS